MTDASYKQTETQETPQTGSEKTGVNNISAIRGADTQVSNEDKVKEATPDTTEASNNDQLAMKELEQRVADLKVKVSDEEAKRMAELNQAPVADAATPPAQPPDANTQDPNQDVLHTPRVSGVETKPNSEVSKVEIGHGAIRGEGEG